MLGNFSFGDYFKKDAIAYAWELITSPSWFGISKDKLCVTIFEGDPLASGIPGGIPPDDEAERHWLAVGISKSRIFRMGMKDNFWQMGDTGPCGPSSEIHFDMGARASEQGHADCKFPCDCGRYVEIWNLVFMQYNRQPRVPGGTLLGFETLPKPSIDTGMGLERVTAVLQGVISNYDTDLFRPLIKRAAELTGGLRPPGQPRAAVPTQAMGHPSAKAGRSSAAETTTAHVGTAALGRPVEQGSTEASAHKSAASLRVIADHSRAATFLISDGVLPSNEGRGYVLRKIIRRAITHGRLLGQTKPFLHQMVFAVRDLMQDAYPELKETSERASKAVLVEEQRFAHTLTEGLARLEDAIMLVVMNTPGVVQPKGGIWTLDAIRDLASRGTSLQLPGVEAFKVYDTYGLPRDFIQDFCRDLGVGLDESGFDQAMEEQKARARASWKGAAKQTANPTYQKLPKSEFEGYRQTRSDGCEVLAIIHNGQGAQELKPGEEGEVILDHTPFYAESGGQVGDRGWLYSEDHNTVVAEVKGCYYPIQGVRAHQVVAKQPIRVGDRVDAVVNTDIRVSTMRNHTATHLLHAGLREILGKHVKQAGSLVAPDHLRFDFSHFTAVEDEEMQDIEDLINKEVLSNQKIEVIENVPIDVAVNEYHAMALFGEKYGDRVRVVKIGDFSTELCGGTHTAQTGEIGLIKILKEGSVSAGVRRVEAVTGEGSLHHFQRDHELETVVSSFVGPTLPQRTRKDGAPSVGEGAPTTGEALLSPAEALKLELDKKDAEIKRLARELDQARMKSASSTVASVSDRIKDVRGVKVLAHRVDNLERSQMRTLVDQLRDKLGSGVVVLGSASNGSVSLIVGVTKDLTSRIQAGKVIGPVALKVGGKGGGRPDLAEAGGKNPEALDSALAEVYTVVESVLGS
jgi:alanyl-tRNA synthetase